MNPSMPDALHCALDGKRLTEDEALSLFDADLAELGFVADQVCRRLHPEPHRTYVVDRNINYSNVCAADCTFCAFYRKAGDPDAYLLTHEEILRKVDEAAALGATQILMQGGLHPYLPFEWYEDLLRTIKSRYPPPTPLHLHSFSPPEIWHFHEKFDLPLTEVLGRLRAAGLDSLPGGGAEILDDEVRKQIIRGKATTEQWLAVMRAAAAVGLPTTATMMFGHLETHRHRIRHLLHLRDLQDEIGGNFTAFIPWAFQPHNTVLGRTVPFAAGATEYLRMVAISRLTLDNFRNLQGSFTTQGLKLGQMSLAYGANDLSGTFIEENVVSATGVSFRIQEEELRRAIRDAGFLPAKRDTYYRILDSPDLAVTVA